MTERMPDNDPNTNDRLPGEERWTRRTIVFLIEVKGWRSRLPLSELVHRNVWGQQLENELLWQALHCEEMFDE